MIARITGTLERLEGSACLIVPEGAPGLAYEVMVPAFAAEALASQRGGVVVLHTIEVYEGSSQGANLTPRLLGFASESDKRFFQLFITVKGLGARKALKAMAEPVGAIAGAIARRDTKWLQGLPEIGKRLAETIVAELHGKADKYIGVDMSDGSAAGRPGSSAEAKPVREGESLGEAGTQAVEALVRLGENRAEAVRKVERVLEQHPETADAGAEAVLAAAFALGS